MKMTVLVVGGAGYIGSHTAHALRRHGYEVVIYDNLSTGHRHLAEGFEFVQADMADEEKLIHALSRTTAVMHFAAHAYVGESVERPRKYFRNNVEAGLALLNATIDSGIRTFVFSSSCAVYGTPKKIPVAEDEPRQPINPYGVSKLFFEHALEAYERAYGLRSVRLRYFNAAGADDGGDLGELHDPETHLIPLALAAAAGVGPELEVFGVDYPTADGTCIRDYIHVNDLAEAHVSALQYLVNGGASVSLNLGTGRGSSIREIMTAIRTATGYQVPWRAAQPRPGDPPVLIADPTNAERTLGWTASRTVEEMVMTAWKWMQRSSALETAY
jgi:UDP-glucose-4-epimerase GalE